MEHVGFPTHSVVACGGVTHWQRYCFLKGMGSHSSFLGGSFGICYGYGLYLFSDGRVMFGVVVNVYNMCLYLWRGGG